jgi:putative restriction endonuclease
MYIFEGRIRMAAFDWLNKQTMYDEVLKWDLLQQGFEFQGQRISLVGPTGIWKPRVLKLPLSIRTSYTGNYDDRTSNGLLIYKYRGANPDHSDNVGLRQAMHSKVPLIYFYGIDKGLYLAVWPVYIEDDNPAALEFTVSVDDKNFLGQSLWEQISDESDILRRRYITSCVKVRLHQQSFRERVLAAYGRQCSFCKLKHTELLDAAHIIPDSSQNGEPLIPNGLSLCKIHHAAFDRHFIGVSPDYQIIVRQDLLHEIDGPMLKYGIQELHSKTLILPKSSKHWPDRDRLDFRFSIFKKAM